MPKRYLITCDFADNYDKKVNVEADTLEEAIQLALADEGDFNASGYAGDTYVSHISVDAGDHELEIQVPPKYAGEETNYHALKEILKELISEPLRDDLWQKAKELIKELER